MTREEILKLLERMADVLWGVAIGEPSSFQAHQLLADIQKQLNAIRPVERLGVPFDI